MEEYKLELKLKKPHPKSSFRVGRHLITPTFKSYSLSEKEIAELKSKGCRYWVEVKKRKEKK